MNNDANLKDNFENSLENNFDSPGSRLNHLLDQISFKKGRGRATDFQNYLIKACPSVFGALKYTTAKSWFTHSAPPMGKISVIVDQLDQDYSFRYDLSLIKTWWKLGGFYPFGDSNAHQLSENYLEKLQYKVMALITEEAGDLFDNLTVDKLDVIKTNTIKFAHDFVDPAKNECPENYLRIMIKHFLKASAKDAGE